MAALICSLALKGVQMASEYMQPRHFWELRDDKGHWEGFIMNPNMI